MIKLTQQNEKNSAKEYDKIFDERNKKGVDEFDMRRWQTLIRHFGHGLLVDLGCLDSEIPSLMNEIDYIGLDLSLQAILEMQSRYPLAQFLNRDIYNTGFDDNYFDYAVLGEVLEHLDEPQEAINEALRILKPGGILAISVPLEEAREPGAKDLHRHIWSFTKQDIYDLVSKDKVIDTEVLGSIHKPVYKYNFPNLLVWVRKDNNGI